MVKRYARSIKILTLYYIIFDYIAISSLWLNLKKKDGVKCFAHGFALKLVFENNSSKSPSNKVKYYCSCIDIPTLIVLYLHCIECANLFLHFPQMAAAS